MTTSPLSSTELLKSQSYFSQARGKCLSDVNVNLSGLTDAEERLEIIPKQHRFETRGGGGDGHHADQVNINAQVNGALT